MNIGFFDFVILQKYINIIILFITQNIILQYDLLQINYNFKLKY